VQIVIFYGVSCMSDQRQFKRKKWHCPYHSEEVKAFSVPAFGGVCLRKIIFCAQCKGILSKPRKLYQYASPKTEVTVYLDNAEVEKTLPRLSAFSF
jgi:hypothetical protein